MQARNHENSDEFRPTPLRHLDLDTPAFYYYRKNPKCYHTVWGTSIHLHDPSTGNFQVSTELWHDGDTEAFQVWKFVKVMSRLFLSEAIAALKGGSSVEIMVSWESCYLFSSEIG